MPAGSHLSLSEGMPTPTHYVKGIFRAGLQETVNHPLARPVQLLEPSERIVWEQSPFTVLECPVPAGC